MTNKSVRVFGIELKPFSYIFHKISVVFVDERGNRTRSSISVSIEDHQCLKLLAARNKITLAKLLGELARANAALDQGRGNLSRTIRRFVLAAMQADPSLHSELQDSHAPTARAPSPVALQAAE
jgi:predicted DNA-binding ribbon-helix-helix protein